MAGICYFAQPNPTLHLKRVHCVKCCSATPDNDPNNRTRTPQFLKLAVSGVTELLRLFSSFDKDRSDRVNYGQKEEISISCIDDVVTTLKTDYENAYFVTGIFTSEIYDEDCIFEDPTIRFQGTELYSRNLKLLVPFFEFPSIGLQKIEKIIRHAESWNVSALEAIAQIFTPSDRN
ncbi:uncharacterized protein LOC116133828 isoform X1 [Pistacia vera]|uniref:uncharacterized protein LOC116133828 isoform X1 n=1 Tax=Pistacia vera TaxID=55513 RepID=UPI001263C45B|nr:uncharacterized protein LOC116133828 isoform X1 [Pistacia vera]